MFEENLTLETMFKTVTVKDFETAKKALADLLIDWSSNTAFSRMNEEAKEQKQTVSVMANRVAHNLLSSFSVRKSEATDA